MTQIDDDSPKERLPEAVGVPRRFAVGSLMIIVTMYAVLFATLTSLGADPVLFGMVAVLFSGVGVGQALLFQGTKPRQASVLVGAVLCPLMLLALFLASLASARPQDVDIRMISQVLAGMAYLTMPGIALGYLAGCSAAGVFFVIDQIRRRRGWPVDEKDQHRSSETPGSTGSKRVGADERLWNLICATITALSLRQKGRPARGALNVFIILAVPVGLAGPFCPWVWWMHVAGTLILAFLSGFLVYGVRLSGWTRGLLFPFLGALGGLGLGVILRNIFLYPRLRLPDYVALGAVPVLGLLMGSSLAALLGWAQCPVQKGYETRGNWKARVAVGTALGVVLLCGGLALWLFDVSQRPAQRALALIEAKSGRVLSPSPDGRSWPVEAVVLYGEHVGDADLQCLSAFDKLWRLSLGHTQIGDAGLAHLKDMSHLAVLDLSGTCVTNAGLKHLSGLHNLQDLSLEDTGIGDAGLANLRGLTILKQLDFSDTRVSDAGLAHLGRLANLQDLNLRGTSVTDAGLVHLSALPSLGHLDLGQTQVTGTGLGCLKTASTLVWLNLRGSQLNDAGLEHVGALTAIVGLDLGETQITDAGLVHLKEMVSLWHLDLDGTDISDAGLEQVAGLASVVSLDLGETRVSDAGLVHLKRMTGLQWLHLDGTEISDAGLEHLKGIASLTILSLENTRVTIDGVNKLGRALPNCGISYDRGFSRITDAPSE